MLNMVVFFELRITRYLFDLVSALITSVVMRLK